MQLVLREGLCSRLRLPISDQALLGRAELLNASDRNLVEAVVIRGLPVETLSRLTGIGARGIRSRVRRITRRLMSRGFIRAARAMAHLPPEDAQLAKLRFCQGMSCAELGEMLGIRQYALRRRLDKVAGVIETLETMQRRSAGVSPAGPGAAKRLEGYASY